MSEENEHAAFRRYGEQTPVKRLRNVALERYACAALTGICATNASHRIASDAWALADAMLAEAQKRGVIP